MGIFPEAPTLQVQPPSAEDEDQSAPQNKPQNNQQQNDKKKKKRSAYDNYKTAKSLIKNARTIINVVSKINPATIIIIVVIIAVIILAIFFGGGTGMALNGGGDNPSPAPGSGSTTVPAIPGLTIKLDGPNSVDNGVDISYTVTVAYDPTVPIDKIELYNDVPAGTTYSSKTTGVEAADSTSTTIAWSLKDPANQKQFSFILRPQSNDIYVNDTIVAKMTGSAGGSSSQEFRDLVAGQGRNTGILGDKNQFVSTIIANSLSIPLTGKESYLSQIYDAGQKYNVNPLILAAIWGVESTFNTSSNYPFGCLNPADAGFTENVTCSAGSLNQLMATFETHAVAGSLEIPSKIGNTCVYTDAFDYAYEMYTPVCHVSDGNDPSRSNFISFYKKFKGV